MKMKDDVDNEEKLKEGAVFCLPMDVEEQEEEEEEEEDEEIVESSSGDDDPTNKEQPVKEPADAKVITTISHFTRRDLPAYWRYGILLYLLGTLALLLASDIGSGLQAITVTVPASNDIWSAPKTTIVAEESIFSSVKQLWDAGTYPLAIFICITSIIWPYVKLLLTIYAWVMPFQLRSGGSGRRRERLLQFLDVLGKWSFADVLVFCTILVAFRATIPTGAGTTLEVYMLALWGFYGFVAATMLGLIGTHVILYHHRKYVNKRTALDDQEEEEEEIVTSEEEPKQQHQESPNGGEGTGRTTKTQGSNNSVLEEEGCLLVVEEGQQQIKESSQKIKQEQEAEQEQQQQQQRRHGLSMASTPLLLILLVSSLVLYLVGCFLTMFQVSRQRGDIETTYVHFSVITIGTRYFDLTMHQTPGDRCIQILWFFLTIILPIISTLLLAILLCLHLNNHNNNHNHNKRQQHRLLYFVAEIGFAWNCAEVTTLAILFAVLEIPKIGTGLIENGCSVCYVIESSLELEAFLPLMVGSILQMMTALWIFHKLHPNYSNSSPSSPSMLHN